MSYKVLFIGDPHVTVEDIPDAQALMDMAIGIARQEGAIVVILGDLHHTHAVIRLEVLNFWTSVFDRMDREKIYWVALVGNHDMPGGKGGAGNSLVANARNTNFGVIVSNPCGLVMLPGLVFFPYIGDPEVFAVEANRWHGSVGLICHDTFNGSQYENGFYAKDGVNLDHIPQQFIISGHIHKPQSFGKLTYPGAPRWRTVSDANTERAIWLYEFFDSGHIKSKKPYDTGLVCRKIYSVEDTELKPALDTLDPAHEWNVDIHGTGEWIEKRLPIFKKQGARVRTFKVQLEQHTVKESEGLEEAYSKWIEEFKPQYGTPKDELKLLSQERTKHGR